VTNNGSTVTASGTATGPQGKTATKTVTKPIPQN
jgi:hypothetical protein